MCSRVNASTSSRSSRESPAWEGGRDALFAQPFRDLLGVPARQCVDDHRPARMATHLLEDLLLALFPGADPVGEVRAIEGADQDLRIPQLELVEDVLADPRGGGRGAGVDRGAGEEVAEPRELAYSGLKSCPTG